MTKRDAALLVVAVGCVSASAPLIAACDAPSLAIAMYRCLFASMLTWIWMAATGRRVRVSANWRVWAAGTALGAHFAAWIPSLRLTSVALSTAMVSTQPIWSALLARATGAKVAATVWWGVVLSGLGVLVMTGPTDTSRADLLGMGLALLGAALAAVYVGFGERLRRVMDLGSYTVAVYGVAAAGSAVVCAAASVPLFGYAAEDWLLIVAITLVAQIGGHSALNAVVHRTSATVVSTAILFEAPGAAVLAALFLGQPVGVSLAVGLAVMLGGLMLVVRGTRVAAEPGV